MGFALGQPFSYSGPGRPASVLVEGPKPALFRIFWPSQSPMKCALGCKSWLILFAGCGSHTGCSQVRTKIHRVSYMRDSVSLKGELCVLWSGPLEPSRTAKVLPAMSAWLKQQLCVAVIRAAGACFLVGAPELSLRKFLLAMLFPYLTSTLPRARVVPVTCVSVRALELTHTTNLAVSRQGS